MKLAALVVTVAATTTAGRADAMCGEPAWVGSTPGTTIPAHGSLYVYGEALDYDSHTHVGGPIVRETRISHTLARLDYDTDARELRVHAGWEDVYAFYVDPHWAAPKFAPRVVQAWHHASHWTCSSTDSVSFQLDQPTAAVRVVWSYFGAPAREWIVPTQLATSPRGWLLNVLELGKINCGGTTIPPEELAVGGELTLYAIRFDGSEVHVDGLPARLSSADFGSSPRIPLDLSLFAPYASTPPPLDDHDPSTILLCLLALAITADLLLLRLQLRRSVAVSAP